MPQASAISFSDVRRPDDANSAAAVSRISVLRVIPNICSRIGSTRMTAPHLELRTLLHEVVLPEHQRRWAGSTSWEALVDFQRQLSAHRWTAPAWPVEFGGRGLDVRQQIACEAEFRRAGAPKRVAVYGVNNVGPTILAAGRPDQLEHATAIAEATELWCQGFSEPDHGSDLAGLRCRAEPDGDDLVVNGSKIWTSIGLQASHCMLLARTDPTSAKHKGISALLVPLDLPGIERRAIKQMDGGADFAELHFTDVRVPATSVLGPLNEGWRVTMATLGFERAGVLSLAGQLYERVDGWVRGAMPDEPVERDLAMQIWSRSRILGWLGERSLAAAPAGAIDISGSLIKLAWSELFARCGAAGRRLPRRPRPPPRPGRGRRAARVPGPHRGGGDLRGEPQHHRRARPRTSEGTRHRRSAI